METTSSAVLILFGYLVQDVVDPSPDLPQRLHLAIDVVVVPDVEDASVRGGGYDPIALEEAEHIPDLVVRQVEYLGELDDAYGLVLLDGADQLQHLVEVVDVPLQPQRIVSILHLIPRG
ncbi:MAG: hypothetical protein IKG94_04085 [Candidatus Methanomethylophilaceae archaeon]|nr:hypothetical protein [Candidatus Methanomethylophilaceae archaeon]MBR4226563.1 hypothetical protein [Candidatus Methanomethylophilaceae archaeon]